ncbi:Rhodanese-like protein [Lenzites betulinus]|nr:Rhodanese-like protein [Lenzites betulinus]
MSNHSQPEGGQRPWVSNSNSSRTSSSYGDVIPRHGYPALDGADEERSTPRSPSPDNLGPIRERVAQTIVLRATRDAELVDGTKIGVVLTLPYSAGEEFLNTIASELKRVLAPRQHPYLFVLAQPQPQPGLSPVLICSSAAALAERAGILVRAKFAGRVAQHDLVHGRWGALVRDLGTRTFDEPALWDAARKAARAPLDPLDPPPGARSVAQLLAHARARLQRISPRAAFAELQDRALLWPVVLVDIRPEAQRRACGGIAGALVVERNVLEWRFDPRCAYRLPIADRYDLRVIVICQESYTSSLAAAALHDLGLLNATDVVGGYAAWKEAGLPDEVEMASSAPPTDGRLSVPVEA